jgi:Fic family protein
MEELHQIDLGSGGQVSLPDQITNPQTRDRYLVSSLMEEAITSSQLEGAVTTREVAKEMIRTGRKPRDNSERMILNNYATMQRIRELKDRDLTPELVLEIHRLVTDGTMEDPTAAGRFRLPHEERVVGDDYDQIVHIPPPAEELEERMKEMCAFANVETPDYFIHPAVRAILLHFWLAYDHPFYDGNGRTARALFYWAMIRRGYWLFEFISISKIIKKAPMKYSLSFLHTETDDNDLTYFLLAQTRVIRQAIAELHAYIRRKTEEFRDAESHMKALDLFNHRQVELLLHAIKHPNHRYTFASHGKSHGIVYQTARADLIDLSARGMLDSQKKGKQWIFLSPSDLSERLMKLGKQAQA